MISKLWLSCVNTSTTEQENRACSDVCWNCGKKDREMEEDVVFVIMETY